MSSCLGNLYPIKYRFRCPVSGLTVSWISLVYTDSSVSSTSCAWRGCVQQHREWTCPTSNLQRRCSLVRERDLRSVYPYTLRNIVHRSSCLSHPHIVSILPAGATAKAGLYHAGSLSSLGFLVRFCRLLPSASIT